MAKLLTHLSSVDLRHAKASWRSLVKNKRNTERINVVSRTGRKFSNAGWREIGGNRYYCRSKWEANYARYLQWLKENSKIAQWEHEPKTFWFEKIKRGVRSYLPDFKVTELDNSYYWVEVKGYYDSKSLTKIKRFKKYYPDEILKLIDKSWFSKNSPKISGLIHDWE